MPGAALPNPRRVVFVEAKPWETDLFQGLPCVEEWDCSFSPATAAELPPEQRETVQVLSCFLRSRIDAEFIETCPTLRLVATRSTGTDHIDLEACAAAGVTVCNVPQYGENTVAEHTFGLILALSRNIWQATDRMKRGDAGIDGLLGFDLNGKTLGVIGAGRIGLHVLRFGLAMNMKALAFDARPQPLIAEVMGFEYAQLDDLLAQSDVVSIHVPLLPATHHLINAERLALMKPSAVLVNTARGAVVDSKALLEALNSGRLAGAALDVLEAEEVTSEDDVLLHDRHASVDTLRLAVEAYQLMHHPKVLVTAHIGFYSKEALGRILETTVDNIRAFFSADPRNIVVSGRNSSA